MRYGLFPSAHISPHQACCRSSFWRRFGSLDPPVCSLFSASLDRPIHGTSTARGASSLATLGVASTCRPRSSCQAAWSLRCIGRISSVVSTRIIFCPLAPARLASSGACALRGAVPWASASRSPVPRPVVQALGQLFDLIVRRARSELSSSTLPKCRTQAAFASYPCPLHSLPPLGLSCDHSHSVRLPVSLQASDLAHPRRSRAPRPRQGSSTGSPAALPVRIVPFVRGFGPGVFPDYRREIATPTGDCARVTPE